MKRENIERRQLKRGWDNNPTVIDARWDKVLRRIRNKQKERDSSSRWRSSFSGRLYGPCGPIPQLLHKGKKP